MILSPVTSGKFVGRTAEQAFLAERFQIAYSQQLSIVVLEGDAGIGKTRLIEEFRGKLPRDVGFGVGCSLEYVRAPYLPFNDVFAQLGLQAPATPAESGHGISSEDKLLHFSAIASALQKYAARRPLAIVIEDIQWADDASIELIHHLGHALRKARVLLVLSCRSDALQQMPNLSSLIGRLSRLGASHIRLGPLARDEVRALAASVLTGRIEFSPELLIRIEEVSDGNPLFIEELLRTALEHAPATGAPLGEIPLTIKAMLWERILPLANKDREILTHAAVIGRSFDADFLAGVTSRPKKQVL